jgi:DNA uptake protein ComE-like DNA-binding protein
MALPRNQSIRTLYLAAALALASVGCDWNSQDQRQRDANTRDEVAKATERAKPVIKEAGRKLDEAAEAAVEEAHAAAQGVKVGWNNGQRPPVDINSATERQLMDLPGITRPLAHRIIAARPYHNRGDLVAKGLLSHDEYLKIRDDIAVR